MLLSKAAYSGRLNGIIIAIIVEKNKIIKMSKNILLLLPIMIWLINAPHLYLITGS